MCRYFAYLGEPIPLSSWLFDAPHSLQAQACQPREMVSGTVNVDGTGLVWWQDGDERAMRYVFDGPPWSDPNLPSLAPRWSSGAQLGIVRSATPGIGLGPEHLQPFLDSKHGLAFMHNGWIGSFRGPVGHAMSATLNAEQFQQLPALNDSAVLFRCVMQRVDAGASPAQALRETASEVLARAVEHNEAATLSVAICDGTSVTAIRTAHGIEPNSLYFSERTSGSVLASEAMDEGEWHAVPPEHIVTMHAHNVSVGAL
ncbi:MAG: glutamine amidotransferase [Gammaproteobacteria bacterium]|jgi:glutamine amidotransferase